MIQRDDLGKTLLISFITCLQPINLPVSVQVEKKTLCYQVAGVTEDALMNGFYVIIVQDILWKDLRCHSESGELKKTCESLGNL